MLCPVFFSGAAAPNEPPISQFGKIGLKNRVLGFFRDMAVKTQVHINLTTYAHILTMKRMLSVYFLVLARNFQWSLDTEERRESTICTKSV